MSPIGSLVWYARDGDTAADEVDLDAMTSRDMRAIFGGSPGEPMVFVYPVSPVHAERLVPYLPPAMSLDFDRFEYFVECHGDRALRGAPRPGEPGRRDFRGGEAIETRFGSLSIHELRIVRRVRLDERSDLEPPTWVLELTLETERRAPNLRATLRFEGVSGLALQDFGGGETRITGFDVRDLSHCGWEGIRLEVVDFENDAIRFYARRGFLVDVVEAT